MANVEHINPETIPPPIANGYTHVVKIGPWVYIAGQVGGKDGVLDPDASVQADIVYTKMKLAMESVGGGLEDLVATTTYVTDADNGQKVRSVTMGGDLDLDLRIEAVREITADQDRSEWPARPYATPDGRPSWNATMLHLIDLGLEEYGLGLSDV